LKEDKDNYYIKTELPGFEKDKIKIDFDNNRLIIQGERSEEINDKKNHFSEISYGTFSRSFMLNKNIDEKETKAKYENGILSIIIPKLNKNEAVNISIE
jgi:HSP20 family protein